MKFSVATLFLALSGSALAGIHTDYRPDGAIEKVYIVKEEVARGIPSISSVTPSSTKRRCGRPPASSSVSSIVSSTSSVVVSISSEAPSSSVAPSSSEASSSAVPSSSEASSIPPVPSSSEESSSSPVPSPSSSSLIPPPAVCVPGLGRCSLMDPGKCCSMCCMNTNNDWNNGQCCNFSF